MKKKLSILVLFAMLFFVACNFGENAKARIVEPQGKVSAAGLDLLEVWLPHGMYCVDWRIGLPASGDSAYLISKGSQKGELLSGSFQLMNRFVNGNELDVDSLNKALEFIPPETPILIHKHHSGNDSITLVTVAHFIVITDNPEDYTDDDKSLEQISRKYIN